MFAAFPRLATAFVGVSLLLLACGNDTPGPTSGDDPLSPTSPFLAIGGGADEQGLAARRTPDGGYLIVGLIGKPQNIFNDLVSVRTDADGAVMRTNPIRRGETYASIFDAVPDADGGIVAITTRDDDAMLVRFAPDGSLAWERNHGTRTGIAWYSLCNAGSGFLISVLPDVFSELNDVELILTNADGTLKSSDTWPSTRRRVFALAEVQDGSFVLAGSELVATDNSDLFVVRTLPGSLSEDWAITTGTPNRDHIESMAALGNDVVVFGNMDDPPGGGQQGYWFLRRVDSRGDEAWTRNIDELGYVVDMASTHDGALAIAAHTAEAASVARLNSDGSTAWTRDVGNDGYREGLRAVSTDAEGFVVTGTAVAGVYTDTDFLLARTDLAGNFQAFPTADPECTDPVAPPPPSNVVGTQRSFAVSHDNGGGLDAVWALSSDFVVAVGDSGYVTRFDGSNWLQMPIPTRDELYDVFGFSRSDVYIAARHGGIFHYDGVSWSEMASTATYLSALWGSDPDDIWAAGTQLLHWDGVEWKDETPKGWLTSIDMDGITATDIYSIGALKEIQHFDGCEWKTIYVALENLRGISAIPGPLVHAAGKDGLVVRYDGQVWETLDLHPTHDFTSVYARSASDVFVVGTSTWVGPYVMYWFNGTSWAEQPAPSTQALLDISGTADGYIFATTSWAEIVRGAP